LEYQILIFQVGKSLVNHWKNTVDIPMLEKVLHIPTLENQYVKPIIIQHWNSKNSFPGW